MSARMILYAEDDANDALFMELAFERAGLGQQLVHVDDGGAAIEYLAGRGKYADRQQHPIPSLLLLDLKLPVKSGFEVLEWIEKQSALKDLKVVVVSSSGHQDDIDRTRKMGAIDYVVKPSSPLRLAEIIRSGGEQWFK